MDKSVLDIGLRRHHLATDQVTITSDAFKAGVAYAEEVALAAKLPNSKLNLAYIEERVKHSVRVTAPDAEANPKMRGLVSCGEHVFIDCLPEQLTTQGLAVIQVYKHALVRALIKTMATQIAELYKKRGNTHRQVVDDYFTLPLKTLNGEVIRITAIVSPSFDQDKQRSLNKPTFMVSSSTPEMGVNLELSKTYKNETEAAAKLVSESFAEEAQPA